jgi:hypothetical protein
MLAKKIGPAKNRGGGVEPGPFGHNLFSRRARL